MNQDKKIENTMTTTTTTTMSRIQLVESNNTNMNMNSSILCSFTRKRRRTAPAPAVAAERERKSPGKLSRNHAVFLLLFAVLQLQALVQVDAVGLRGVLPRQQQQQQQQQAAVLKNTASPIDEASLLFHQPLSLDSTADTAAATANNEDNYYKNYQVLSCEIDFGSEYHCPPESIDAIPQTPVCEYEEENANFHNYDTNNDYKTVCLDTNASGIALLYNPHPKTYCGACKKCFETTDELKQAVHRYESYKVVDMELANTYGWPIGNWCIDGITDLSSVFFRKSQFNESLHKWDTSRVTDMTATFQNAFDFDQPLNHWDVSRVTSTERMFAMAIHFNQPLHHWNVSRVENFSYQFLHALEFNQDLSPWNTQNAINLNSMFLGANSFVHGDAILSQWEIQEHADTEHMCQWSQAIMY